MSLHHGDCLEVMAGMEPESVDAVVTDPPYGLEFMGKAWDAPWRKGGETSDGRLETRPDWNGRSRPRQGSAYARSTHHRCRTCGRQEFSGTPCSCATPNWEMIASAPTQLRAFGLWSQQWAEAAYRVAKPSAYLLAFGGTRTVHRLTSAIEDAGWIIRDMLVWAYASGFPKSKASLKPAWEPIVMARKPGPLRMLAIDECRIGTTKDVPASGSVSRQAGYGMRAVDESMDAMNPNLGRWPANVILTATDDGRAIFDGGWDGVVGGGEARSSGEYSAVDHGPDRAGWVTDFGGKGTPGSMYGDSGTYSRFFLIPKADRADREPVVDVRFQNRVYETGPVPRANVHPTVKPVDLMRHLVRLVTPTGGTVLDPFAGSGSTAIAAEMEGFDWIGIEKEAEYVAIAEARLNGTQRGLGLPA